MDILAKVMFDLDDCKIVTDKQARRMTILNNSELTSFVENSYFGNVDNKFLESVMECFHPDATLTVQTANTTHNGTGEIRRMFTDFFHNYRKIWHGEYEHVVDVDRQMVAVQFTATRETHDGEHQRALNSNFFEFEDRKIKSITIYMSDQNPLV